MERAVISISEEAKREMDKIREKRPSDVPYRVIVDELLARYGDEIGEGVQVYGSKSAQ